MNGAPTRLRPVNGDQYAVIVESNGHDEEAGFVVPAVGGWLAIAAGGYALGVVPTRKDAVSIMCSEYGLGSSV